MTISTIRKDDLDELASLMNRAFEDYLVPMQVSPDQLRYLMRVDDIQLGLSAWIREEDHPVGFSLVGLRSGLARIGPFGIEPSFRGRGLGSKLLRHTLTTLAEGDAGAVELEVIRSNLPAFKLYETNGFFIKRELLSFRCPGEPPSRAKDPGLVPLSGEEVLARFEQYHPCPPSWQRSASSLSQRLSQCEVVGLGNPHEPRAYLILDEDRIHDAYWDPDIGQPVLEQFLACVASRHGRLSIINVADEDPLAHSFVALGWECFLRQYEMRYDLAEVA